MKEVHNSEAVFRRAVTSKLPPPETAVKVEFDSILEAYSSERLGKLKLFSACFTVPPDLVERFVRETDASSSRSARKIRENTQTCRDGLAPNPASYDKSCMCKRSTS